MRRPAVVAHRPRHVRVGPHPCYLTRSSDSRPAGHAASSELENDLRDAAGVQLYAVGASRIDRVYSLNEKREAVRAARQLGIREAARKLDIPNSTLRRWTTDGIDAEQGGNHHPESSSPKGCGECGVEVTTYFDTRTKSGVIRVWMCRDCWSESWELASVRERDRAFFEAMRAAVRRP